MASHADPPPPTGNRFLDALQRVLFRYYGPAQVGRQQPPDQPPEGPPAWSDEWVMEESEDGGRYLRRRGASDR